MMSTDPRTTKAAAQEPMPLHTVTSYVWNTGMSVLLYKQDQTFRAKNALPCWMPWAR